MAALVEGNTEADAELNNGVIDVKRAQPGAYLLNWVATVGRDDLFVRRRWLTEIEGEKSLTLTLTHILDLPSSAQQTLLPASLFPVERLGQTAILASPLCCCIASPATLRETRLCVLVAVAVALRRPFSPELPLGAQLPDTTSSQRDNKKRKTRHKGSGLKHEEKANESSRSRSSSRNPSAQVPSHPRRSSSQPALHREQPHTRAAAAHPSTSLPHHLSQDEQGPERALTPESFTSSHLAGWANLSLDSQSSESPTDPLTKGGSARLSGKVRALETLNSVDRNMRASSPAKRTRSEMESGVTRQDSDEGAEGGSPLRSELTLVDQTQKEHVADAPKPPLSEQVKEIINLVEQPLVEGEAGYVVSQTWLTKAREQAEKGELESDPLGPVDNSKLHMVVDKAGSVLLDERGGDFVPLKPGLQIKVDYDIVPSEAWNKMIQWHGHADGSPIIVRYCHNTSQVEFVENMQFETYPPVFTLFKLPQTPSTAAEKSSTLPVKILLSRTEQFQKFLKRAKQEAKIPLNTNVRVWRLASAAVEAAPAQPGVLTPANSRSASPAPNITTPIDLGKSLAIDVNTFVSFSEGSQRELLDVRDETSKPIPSDKSTCGEAGLGQEGIIVLEEQTGGSAGGEWVTTIATQRLKSGALIKGNRSEDGMLKPGPTASGRSSPAPGIMTRGRAGKGRTKGTVGLSNLGNTCYMNSALQCVRACMELTEYFLGDFYKRELNPSNPLGNKGEVAKAYAQLLKDIYKGSGSSVCSPSAFRKIIGKYNHQFSGFQQQDSQEFVLFLLDGLQEDLNRITKKPYIEKPDSTDEMVHDHEALVRFAEENWRIYKARNDSVITDLFAGMYKSTLQCPVCDKVSIIFDPFNNLTLSLPIANTWSHECLFFPLNSRPVKLIVEVDKTGEIADVRRFVANKVEVPLDRLVLTEFYHERIYKIFKDSEPVSDVREGDILAAYEIEATATNWPEPKKTLMSHVNDDENGKGSKYSERILVPICFRTPSSTRRKVLFGLPSFILLTREEAKSYDTILRKVLNRLSTATTASFLEEEGTADEDSDAVLMTTEDAESGSSEGKIHTHSVQGEDGFVDVSMRDSDASHTEEGPRYAYPPMVPLHTELHSTLREGNLLPNNLDQLFNMLVYRGSEMVPTGPSVPEDTKQYPSLKKRRNDMKYKPDVKARPLKRNDNKKILARAIQNGGSASDSEDELASHALPPPAGTSSPQSGSETANETVETTEEESDDGIPPVQEATDTISPRHGELHVARLVDYDTDSEPDIIDAATAHKQKVVSNEISPEPLIRLGEGIVLDFEEEQYQYLFMGGDDDDKTAGVSTHEHITLLPDPELDKKQKDRKDRKKNGVSLDDCLDEFGKPEVLSENDAWFCPKCKEHRRASKTFELWKVPDVLVIHLKRFAVQGRFRDKLDVLVNFPTQGLDLTERMKGKEEDGRELVYDLFAVDNHYGGLGGGHYTAYAENFVDENWYYFDDTSTSPRKAEDSVTTAAYLLFYRRRNSNVHLGGPSFDKVYAELTDSSYTAAESEPTSRAASPGGFSGEGRRLGGSSRNGSSSAYHAAEAVHQAGGGGPETSAEEEQEPEQGRQAQIAANGVNSEDEYDAGEDELPSYDQSEEYGPAPWDVGPAFSWGNLGNKDEDGDNSSTAAVGDDEQSVGSGRFGGTPEKMDEDAAEFPTQLLSGIHTGRGVTPEHVTEIELDDDEVMKD